MWGKGESSEPLMQKGPRVTGGPSCVYLLFALRAASSSSRPMTT
jgi:hypothetical protein